MSSINKANESLNKVETPVDSYWQSLGELENTPEFNEMLVKEYGAKPGDLVTPVNRRRFVQLMGASMAFAGVLSSTGCRWEEEKIIPLSKRPDGYVPGNAKTYATSWEFGGYSEGLEVTAYDGRPTKIEGNSKHPYSGSASTAFAQASILELYDPDRARKITRNEAGKSVNSDLNGFKTAVAALAQSAAGNSGQGFAVLSEKTQSPTVLRLKKQIQSAMPNLLWAEYQPWDFGNEALGTKAAFGSAYRAQLQIAKADLLVSFDADLFGCHPAALANAKGFGAARDPKRSNILRTYAIESVFTSLGSVADHRLPVRAEHIKVLLMGLEALLGGGNLSQIGSAILAEERIAKFLSALAGDIKKFGAKAVVAVGARQPAEVHAIAARINSRIGASGNTVVYSAESNDSSQSIAALVAAAQKGGVANLLMLGGNPVYDAPADLDFKAALAKIQNSVHLSSYHNETSALANWHVPKSHFLESWGDGRSYDGTVSITQPIIKPIHQSLSTIEVLKELLGMTGASSEDLVKETFAGLTGQGANGWKAALHDGIVLGTKNAPQSPSASGFTPTPLTPSQKAGTLVPNGQLEVVFTPSNQTFDGRFANSSWLVEVPDMITKLTWDNAGMISKRTAETLGIKHGEMMTVAVDGAQIDIVACITPGMAAFSVGLPLGWGRTRAGNIGGHAERNVKSIGFDVYPLRKSSGMGFRSGATVSGKGTSYPLGETQDHFMMDELGEKAIQARANTFIKTVTVAEAKHNPHFVLDEGHISQDRDLIPPDGARKIAHPTRHSLFNEQVYTAPYQWGMTTDLSKCIGCNSCVVACQAENNIPVVGKTQVRKNREMHWIRIDRYFKGNPEHPSMAFQPVACQQCENAPCEQVCPVGATVHSVEGLNDMAYNRCVGTRYCANNCPYKVRRFNFHYWHKELDESRADVKKLVFNPDVTVRSRGVIEKCTFCVQRLERAKITHKNEVRRGRAEGLLVDGTVKTACQQACPTGAIEFGNLNKSSDKSPESKVATLQKDPRAYALLAGLNTKPRNAYLARIANPNEELSGKKTKEEAHHG